MDPDKKQKLLELVDSVADLRKAQKRLSDERQELQSKQHIIWSRVTLEVAQALDNSGKRIYSNDHMRDAARNIRLIEHSEYQERAERIRELNQRIDNGHIELARLEDQRRILAADAGIDPYFGGDGYLGGRW